MTIRLVYHRAQKSDFKFEVLAIKKDVKNKVAEPSLEPDQTNKADTFAESP